MAKRIKIVGRENKLVKQSVSLKEDPKASRAMGDAASDMFNQFGNTIETYGKFKAKADNDSRRIQADTYKALAQEQALIIKAQMHREGVPGRKYREEFTKRYKLSLGKFREDDQFDLLSAQHRLAIGTHISNGNLPDVLATGAKKQTAAVQGHFNDKHALLRHQAHQKPSNVDGLILNGKTEVLKATLNGVLEGNPIAIKRHEARVVSELSYQAATGHIKMLEKGADERGNKYTRKTPVEVTRVLPDGTTVKKLSTPEKEINRLITHLPRTEQDKIRKDMRDAEAFAMNQEYVGFERKRTMKNHKLEDASSKLMLKKLDEATKFYAAGSYNAGNAKVVEAMNAVSEMKMTREDAFKMRNSAFKIRKERLDTDIYKKILSDSSDTSLKSIENELIAMVKKGSVDNKDTTPWFARLLNMKNNKGGASQARQMARYYDKKLSLYSKYDSSFSMVEQLKNTFKGKEELFHRARKAHVELLHGLIKANGDEKEMERVFNEVIRNRYSDVDSRKSQLLFPFSNIILNSEKNINEAEELLKKRIRSKEYTTDYDRKQNIKAAKMIQQGRELEHLGTTIKNMDQEPSKIYNELLKDMGNPVIIPYNRDYTGLEEN